MKIVSMLRGINVGGHHKVAMSALKELYIELGLTEVRTLLNSGNVICEVEQRKAKGLEVRIEKAFAERFGFAVGVVNRTPEQLKSTVGKCPFAGAQYEEKKVAVAFLQAARTAALVFPKGFTARDGASGTAAGGEEVLVGHDVVYVYYANGQADTKLTLMVIEKMVGTVATARGWGTVKKLLAIVST